MGYFTGKINKQCIKHHYLSTADIITSSDNGPANNACAPVIDYYPLAISSHHCQGAVQWIMGNLLKAKLAKITNTNALNKIINPQLADPIFWSAWFARSGIKQIIKQTVPQARLLRQVVFSGPCIDQTTACFSAEINLPYRSGMKVFWLQLAIDEQQQSYEANQPRPAIKVGTVLAWSAAQLSNHHYLPIRQATGLLLVMAPTKG